MEREELKAIIKQIVADKLSGAETEIPIGVSNRHIHLTETDYNQLFPNEPIQVKKWLKQPGECCRANPYCCFRKGRTTSCPHFRTTSEIFASRAF